MVYQHNFGNQFEWLISFTVEANVICTATNMVVWNWAATLGRAPQGLSATQWSCLHFGLKRHSCVGKHLPQCLWYHDWGKTLFIGSKERKKLTKSLYNYSFRTHLVSHFPWNTSHKCSFQTMKEKAPSNNVHMMCVFGNKYHPLLCTENRSLDIQVGMAWRV